MTAALREKTWGCFHLTGTVEVRLSGTRDSGVYSSLLGTKGKCLFCAISPESACHACMSTHSTANVQRAAMPRDVARKQVQMKEVRMAMTYDAFLDQMKKDLEAGFAEDLPEMGNSTGASPCMLRQAKYSQVKIGIRDVEKLQGESYRGISFRVGDAPIEGNLNMQYVFQVY